MAAATMGHGGQKVGEGRRPTLKICRLAIVWETSLEGEGRAMPCQRIGQVLPTCPRLPTSESGEGQTKIVRPRARFNGPL